MPLSYAIEETVLPNGLRVVVNSDHAVPLVAVNLWVGVGARHETPGRTGLAHLFEHLMFQGSANVAEGEHFAALLAEGARMNATTSFDRTNYFETVPRGAMELALWLEADRHGGLLPALTQENFDNQRDVVKEEKRQRYDNVPYGDWLDVTFKLVFPADHPYHHIPIGSMADLDAATLADAQNFYRAHYRPSNTVLTLAGDVTAEEGFALAERYFGHLADPPAESVSVRPFMPALPPLPEPVSQVRAAEVPLERVYLAFRLPEANSEGFLAATLALDALGGLTASRLEKRLVRGDEAATSVSAFALGLVENTSLGVLIAEVAEGSAPEQVEKVMCEVLDAFADEGPTVAELEAAQAQFERGWLSSLASLPERADHIGQFTCLHDDPRGIETYIDRLASITAEQVREVSDRYLRPGSRATITYVHAESPTTGEEHDGRDGPDENEREERA